MATPYIGVSGATQAPSDPADPGNVPTVLLPADGDDVDAASVAQAYKCLADFCASSSEPLPPLIAYKDQTRYQWIAAGCFQVGTNWTLDLGITTGSAAVCATASGAGYVLIPVPLFYCSASEHQTLTAVGVRVTKASTGSTTVKAYAYQNLSSTGGGPVMTQIGTTTTSTTSGNQIITVSGLTGYASDDQLLLVEVSAANNGDIVYAAKATYNNAAIV